jgi:hypothetical protein
MPPVASQIFDTALALSRSTNSPAQGRDIRYFTFSLMRGEALPVLFGSVACKQSTNNEPDF